jgi:hypothetical protein
MTKHTAGAGGRRLRRRWQRAKGGRGGCGCSTAKEFTAIHVDHGSSHYLLSCASAATLSSPD